MKIRNLVLSLITATSIAGCGNSATSFVVQDTGTAAAPLSPEVQATLGKEIQFLDAVPVFEDLDHISAIWWRDL